MTIGSYHRCPRLDNNLDSEVTLGLLPDHPVRP
jgi:hypothetical protein